MTNNITTTTSPLALKTGLSLTDLLALDNVRASFAPGKAVCLESNSGGAINSVEIQDGTLVTISIAGSGANPGDILKVFIDNVLVDLHQLVASEISNSTGGTTGDGIARVIISAEVLKALSQGPHYVTSQIAYADGSFSGVSTALGLLNIDTIGPDAPVAPVATDDVGQAQGTIAQGAITDDAKPVISGTIAAANNTIQVFDNGVSLGKATVNALTGKWMLEPATALTDGPHAITIIEYDRAGNPSPVSAPLNFIVDTGTASVVINNATDNAGDIQGNVANGGVTDDTTPTLVGTAKADAVVTISEGNTVIGTTTANSLGQWSFTPTGAQSQGAHTYTASMTVAGNTITSTDFVITVDTTAPDVVVTPVGDNLKTAAEATDAAGVMTVKSEVDAVSTVTFVGQSGTVIKTIVNNGTAKPVVLTATELTQLGDGAVEVTTVTKDKAGNSITTPDGNDGDFTLDTKPPVAVADSNTGTEDVATLTGNVSTNDTGKDGSESYALVGSATGLYGTLTLNANGTYSYARTANLDAIQATAVDTFTYQVTDAAGNSTTSTLTLNMTPVNDAAVIGGVSTATLNETNAAQTATGTLTITDVDSATTFVAQTATAGSNGYGKFSLTAAGVWTYTMNTAHDEFVAGTAYTDSFTATSADGTTKLITVTINGTNDAAVIGGVSTATLTQNATAQSATGTLSITDVDSATTFTALTDVAGSNGYGKFSLTAAGVWTYTMNTAHAEFVAGTVYTDSVTVTSADGTTKLITVTINGSNDAAVIGGVSTATLTETNAAQTATGTLTSTDVDSATTFVAQTAAAGSNGYGKFSLTAAGAWTYTMNTAHDEFVAGTVYTDSFTATSADGTTKVVTVTINGTNDAAVISGTNTGAVTEAGGVANAIAGTPTASGTLTSTDVDGVANAFTAVSTATTSIGGYGIYTMTAAGVWVYTLNNSNITVQALAAGATMNDTFAVGAADGTAKLITVTITGSNDAAVISGTNTGAVTEAGGIANGTAGTPTATGTLSSTDVDGTANAFTAVSTATTSTGGYGSYVMTAAGVWTYTLNNANTSVQALAAGATLTDTFTVSAADGTTKLVTVTITGANDAAVIGGVSTATLTETNAAQTATGTLTITDVDNATTFAVQSNVAGSNGYGKFSLTAAGVWSYTMNTAHDEFVAGTVYTDSFTATSADGTTKLITVTINGTNDAAVISGTTTGAVTEAGGVANAIAGTPTATGTLTSTDMDGVANVFTAVSTATASIGGYGTYTMTAAGVWTYALHNNNATVQALAAAATLTDTFTVTSADGTAKTINVTITGANDAAVIAGTSTASLNESNVAQTASGTLTATDVDGTANLFNVKINVAGNNGFGTFSIASSGVWTYTMNTAHDEFVAGQVYTDSIIVTSADGTSQPILVTINGTNDAPVVAAAIPDQIAVLGTPFSYTMPVGTFSDPDSTLTYTVTRGDGTALPSWITFDAATRTFSGTPTDTIDFNIKVTASDGTASISDTFLLGIAPVASSAAITSATGIQNNFLNEGDTVTATVNFGEKIYITGTPQITLNIGGTLVKANYVSGSGTSAIAFSYTILAGQTDANGISINANSLGLNGGTLKDAFGNNATQNFAALTDNISYQVDTTAAVAVADSNTGTEDVATLTGNVSTNDTGKDGSESYALVGSATGLYGTLTLNANGTYSYARTANLDAIQATAVDTFTYQVTDAAGNSTTSTLTLNMTPVNDAPVFATDVTRNTLEDTTFEEQVSSLLVGKVTDVDSTGIAGIAITWDFGTGHTSTGTWYWADSSKATWTAINKPAYGPSTSIFLKTTDYLRFVPALNADTSTQQGNLVVRVADDSMPTTASGAILNLTGLLPNYWSAGEHSIIVNLTPVNDAPIVANQIADTTGTVGTALSYTVAANAFTDVDSPTLSYSFAVVDANGTALATQPTWLSFNATTRTFTGTPPAGAAGTVFVKVTASDGSLSANDTFNIVVTAPDTLAPILVGSNPSDNGYVAFANVGQNLTLTFSEAVKQGTGLIQLFKADGTLVESFDAASSSLVTGWNGSTLTINPSANLLAATGYYIKIAPTAVKDLVGNAYAGITDATTLNFSTTDEDGGIPPTAMSGAGYVVSSAGDVNGDGFDDVIVGAPTLRNEPYTGAYLAGGAYVIYGNAAGTLPALPLNTGNGVNASIAANVGFKISSAMSANTKFGKTVSGIGDINGDGFDDVMMGGGGTLASAYVVYGGATNAGVAINNAGNINNSQGFKIFNGVSDSTAAFGSSVTGLGDVNGDGVADFGVALGASSWVIYGSTTNQSDLQAGYNFAIDPSRGYLLPGFVTAVGDMNNDGMADVVANTYNSNDNSFAATIYYSTGNGSTNPTNVAYSITGTISNSPMNQVTSMGDVNGDGIADLAVMSSNHVFVVYGQTGTTNVALSTLSASQGFKIVLPVGSSRYDWISSAGDVNGDGLADVIIGKQSGYAAFAMVVYGNATGTDVQLSHILGYSSGYNVSDDAIAPSQGFKISSPDGVNRIGWRVSNAGDFNGDGLADLIVGGLPTQDGLFGIVLGGTQFVTNAVQGSGTVNGTSGSEALFGSTANDTLTGGGGVDRFFAGEGDDTIVLTATEMTNLANVTTGQTVKATIDGGGGFDTLRLTGGANLNLTAISNVGALGLEENSRIESIERIDMGTDAAANTLTLAAKDVSDMAGFNNIHLGGTTATNADGRVWTNVTGTALSTTTKFHQLVVDGSASDVVNFTSEAGWANAGIVNNGTSNYTVWQNTAKNAQILVQSGVTVASPLSFALGTDTGTSASDFITKNGTMNVSLSVSTDTWSYSTDSGTTWATGSGTSFVVGVGTYAANAVQVRENGAGGQTVAKLANALTVDMAAPTVAVTMSDVALALGEKSTVTFQFSENVANFDINDVAIQNSVGGAGAGGLSALTKVSDSKWTAIYTPTTETNTTGNHIVVALNGYNDVAGNNGASGQSTFNVDTRFSSSLTAGFYGTTSSSSSANSSVTTNAVIVDYWNPAWQGDTITTYKNGAQIDSFTISGATNSKSLGNLTASPGDTFYSTITHNGVTYNLFNMIKVNPGTAGLTRYDSPLVLDLNGDGVQTVDMAHGTAFDLQATGTAQATGWVDAHDGLLAIDLNHDGQINSGAELFGSSTLLANGQKAADGWAALAQYDSNGDGNIDAQDAAFDAFKVWQDANGNGVTDAGELRNLKDVGVNSINLGHDNTITHQNGNLLQGVSSFTTTDGKTHEVVDAWFQTVTTALDAKHDDVFDARQALPKVDVAPVSSSSSIGDSVQEAGRITATDMAGRNVLSFDDVLAAPDWQAHDITSAHVAYSLNSTSALTDELMYKVSV